MGTRRTQRLSNLIQAELGDLLLKKVKDPRIVPEMGVNVSFLEAAPKADAPAPQGVRVPAAAVVERDGTTVAFVVEGDKVQRRTLKPGQTLASERQILDGLRAGEQVVLDPPATLKDGDSVRVGDGAPAS